MPHFPVRDALLGLAVGDALGVPVEFRSRAELKADPVTGMRGYGTHDQPPGTWSDDSSLAFCLAESLIGGYDLQDIAGKFIAWKEAAYWTPRGEVFDIGLTTSAALGRLAGQLSSGQPLRPELSRREADAGTNGNGSLMRTLPLYFEIGPAGVESNFRKIWEVSALTHPHIRSALACLIYLLLADELVRGKEIAPAYSAMQERASVFFQKEKIPASESRLFDRLLTADISDLPETAICSGGYVLDSLEAAVWCLLTSTTYAETVLKAVNLGEDTDTTAAIAGGLAGLRYGAAAIPEGWVSSLARLTDIDRLCRALEAVYQKKTEN